MASTLGAVMNVIQTEQQARAMEYNARVAKMGAAEQRIEAGTAADQQWRKDRAAMAVGNVAFARGGVSLAEGSPLALKRANLAAAADTTANILNQGERNATNLENQSKLLKWQASSARTGSYINVGFAIAADVVSAYSGGATGTMQSKQTWDSSGTEATQKSSFMGINYNTRVDRMRVPSNYGNLNETGFGEY